MTDIDYMKQALELAKKGIGWVNPNPMVGAVIVKDGTIIGMGFHQRFGMPHAEREALSGCRQSPQGATLYVTLEPCCHYGKTPPCTDAILKSGIRRVVIGSLDPNPVVAGKGASILRHHGIEVTEGVLSEECRKLNRVFFHFIKHQTPYVVMKYAMTMDGKIATYSGKSKWITGEAARLQVQKDRHRYSGIMVGVSTILTDDPMLTCRFNGCKSPQRIVCDTSLRTPLSSRVVQTADQYKTILAACCTDQAKIKPYEEAGCEVLTVSQKEGKVDLKELMIQLGKRNVDSILLEGGSTLNWSALTDGIVNKVQVYIAPKLFGGIHAKSPVGGIGMESPDNGVSLSPPQITVLGEDILLESEVL
ncbi:bifunctional diaminohydroxyphosphoribosylaminopyrimidine deaminase/5-amino-6-(5-phosphoribosylamino)uracil reductase RibD [Lacrimispora sp. JR3]|uniref:bifunctional diaminohydroxyphosphoribosylaminopyrimidine deaminase/5-amino-6-(5-phosphoribosylamino)uracil reductase RibD n=1 Tax=Lacrimispora sinapis TaxID=3111456 RepID=UPI003748F15E